MSMNRRHFVVQVGAGAIAAQAGLAYAGSRSANEPLRMAVIGFRGRGKALIGAIKRAKNAKLVALADVDEKVLHDVEKDNQSLVRATDFRELLDRNDIDAIASATPNHWHSMIAIMACQSGKHVYIEKPISHNMIESQAVVAASDRYKKLVQCGFQNRSDTGLTGFFQKLHAGDYGKVISIHGTCHRSRASIGKLEKPLDIPKHIDYDLWLGPASQQAIVRPRLHYDWHWDFNTGNGDVGNQGPHEWDMMNWALGDPDNLPTKMIAAGNRFGWEDAGNTPNVMACIGESNGIPIYFEVMDLNPGGRAPHGRGVGVIIETERGKFIGGRGGGRFEFANGDTERFSRDKSQRQDGTSDHMQNFVDAVLTDNRSSLRSDCRVASRSSSMAHMANISYQLGKKGASADIEAAFTVTPQGRDMLGRLRESTKIYSRKNGNKRIEPWLLGTPLEFDNVSQKFVGSNSEPANQKMARDYRSGFELPKIS